MVIEDGVDLGCLWMSNKDILENAENNPSQESVLFSGLMCWKE
jgi:hypothetical protein